MTNLKPERRTLSGLFDWPTDGVRVTRGTRWGNPHKVDNVGSNEEAVRLYRDDLLAGRLRISVDDARDLLRGRHLYCFCKSGEACHADVLIAVANEDGVSAAYAADSC
jgi:hypothetical protein